MGFLSKIGKFFTGSSGAGMLTAGLNAVGNLGSTMATNKANAEIAQMNNEFNERMLEKQMDYNKEMYATQMGDIWKLRRDEQEYNSAAAQRQRFEEAGLNPALMMQGQSAGSVSSQSAPAAQGVNPPTASEYHADYSGVGRGISEAIRGYYAGKVANSQSNVSEADAMLKNIESKTAYAKAIAEIDNLLANTKDKDSQRQLRDALRNLEVDYRRAQINNTDADTFYKQQNAKGVILDNMQKSEYLKVLPRKLQNDLASQVADIQLKLAQGELTRNQAEHEIKKMAETVAKTELTNQKYWTESANTINAQLENTSKQMDNQFQAETYQNRVRQVEEELWNTATEFDKFGVVRSVGKGIRVIYETGKQAYNKLTK